MTYDQWKTTDPNDKSLGRPEEDEDEGEFWCEECHNTGSVECYCGGDLCVCEYNGEMPCPCCA